MVGTFECSDGVCRKRGSEYLATDDLGKQDAALGIAILLKDLPEELVESDVEATAETKPKKERARP